MNLSLDALWEAHGVLQPLTQKEVDALAPDPASRINALNYLSSAVRSLSVSPPSRLLNIHRACLGLSKMQPAYFGELSRSKSLKCASLYILICAYAEL